MKLIDYAPHVLDALKSGKLNQGDLSEAVFGSSGRGNSGLTNSLFPLCVRRGWVKMESKGRSKFFEITETGRKLVGEGDPLSNWDLVRHDFK